MAWLHSKPIKLDDATHHLSQVREDVDHALTDGQLDGVHEGVLVLLTLHLNWVVKDQKLLRVFLSKNTLVEIRDVLLDTAFKAQGFTLKKLG